MATIIRTSLFLVSLFLLSLPFAHSDSSSTQYGKPKYLVGLQLYTVRDDCAKDFPGTIKKVAQLGFTGVEFAGYYGRTAQEVRQMLDENKLKCYGTHIGLDALMPENFEKTVEFNKVIGNSFLIVASLPHERMSTRAAIFETAKVFNEISQKLLKHKMLLGFHNHAAEFRTVEGELIFDTFFKNTDKRVAIQFDTGNAMSAGYQPTPFMEKYPKRVLSSHVKEFSATNPNAMLGEGDVNWKDVVKFFKSKNRPKWFIIEHENYPFPPMECAEKCLRNFEKLMAAK